MKNYISYILTFRITPNIIFIENQLFNEFEI
jgi:hypothetical protein